MKNKEVLFKKLGYYYKLIFFSFCVILTTIIEYMLLVLFINTDKQILIIVFSLLNLSSLIYYLYQIFKLIKENKKEKADL